MSRISELWLGKVVYDNGRAPISFGAHQFRHAALIAVVRSDDGAIGTGIAWAQIDDELGYVRAVRAPLYAAIDARDALAPFVAAAACQAEAYRIAAARVAAAVEMALWDLAGRLLKVPCYQLLGCRRRTLPSYVISAEDFFIDSVAQYVELATRYVEAGFRGCKFHLWGKADRDVDACRAIRDAVGPDVALMLDPAGRYSREEAVRVGRAIEELGFVRYEDPLPPGDAAGYRWLATRVSVPLVVNESLRWNAEQCAAAARTGIVQGFRMELGRAGVGETLRIATIAEANGAELDVAAFAPRGALDACLHVALASPATRWFEHHEALGLDEIPGIAPGFVIENGVAHPLDGAGFGFDIDWPELERHCEWVR
jgi:L-alanine-DL-glutamate epimerase-like enolase superfamily enzyme